MPGIGLHGNDALADCFMNVGDMAGEVVCDCLCLLVMVLVICWSCVWMTMCEGRDMLRLLCSQDKNKHEYT